MHDEKPEKVIPLRAERPDLGALARDIKALVYERCGRIGLAEAIGVLEIVKLDIFMEQK